MVLTNVMQHQGSLCSLHRASQQHRRVKGALEPVLVPPPLPLVAEATSHQPALFIPGKHLATRRIRYLAPFAKDCRCRLVDREGHQGIALSIFITRRQHGWRYQCCSSHTKRRDREGSAEGDRAATGKEAD